jgi:hypothetical protein
MWACGWRLCWFGWQKRREQASLVTSRHRSTKLHTHARSVYQHCCCSNALPSAHTLNRQTQHTHAGSPRNHNETPEQATCGVQCCKHIFIGTAEDKCCMHAALPYDAKRREATPAFSFRKPFVSCCLTACAGYRAQLHPDMQEAVGTNTLPLKNRGRSTEPTNRAMLHPHMLRL